MTTPEDAIVRRLTEACGYLVDPETEKVLGSTYLISRNQIATCEHVVAQFAFSRELIVQFPAKRIERRARVIRLDREHDCALLSLAQSVEAVAPLVLGDGCSVSDSWRAYGFPEVARIDKVEATGIHLNGTVAAPEASDPSGTVAIQLGCDGLSGISADVHGLSGAPVLVDGKVIGHIEAQLSLNTGGNAFGLLWASPVRFLAEMLKNAGAEAEHSGALRLLDVMVQSRVAVPAICDVQVNPVRMLGELEESIKRGRPLDLRHHYLGPGCARNWIQLSQQPAYGRVSAMSLMKDVARRLTDEIDQKRHNSAGLVSLVSLGCGDGALDLALLDHLMTFGTNVKAYFPVDISSELLQSAVAKIRGLDALNTIGVIPILADINELDRISEIWPGSPHLEIVSLLGFTLGNAESESRLLDTIVKMLGPEDLLLIDARCYKGPAQSLNDGFGKELKQEMLKAYKHEANERFALGPLQLLTHKQPRNGDVEYAVVANPRSDIPDALDIRTNLRIDDGWRDELRIHRSRVGSVLTLARSTAYPEQQFEKWLLGLRFGLEKRYCWSDPQGDGLLCSNSYLVSRSTELL